MKRNYAHAPARQDKPVPTGPLDIVTMDSRDLMKAVVPAMDMFQALCAGLTRENVLFTLAVFLHAAEQLEGIDGPTLDENLTNLRAVLRERCVLKLKEEGPDE